MASPFADLPFGRCTRKGDRLYLHVLAWPADGVLSLPLATPLKSAHLLAHPDKPLPVETDPARGLRITIPVEARDPIATVVVVELDGEMSLLEPRSDAPRASAL